MKLPIGICTLAIALGSLDSPYVERPAPGAPPTAFRIWAAGENMSDDGPTYFTPRSAELLMAEQEARGRTYPSDFDHLSLVSDRPAESGRASGYHRLEVRKSPTGPELWAVEIEWCEDVQAALSESPPRWRYFSPAFKQDEKKEVFSYINFALCINPKTHKLPSLAGIGTGDTKMNKKAMKAFLAKMAEGATDDAAKTAYATIAAAIGDDDEEKKPEAKAEGEGEKKKDPPCEPEAKAEGEGEKKDPPGDEDKVEKNAINATIAADLAKANAKIAALEIKGMLDARPDISDSLRKWAMTQDSETVRGFLSSAPKGSAVRNETTTTTDSVTARAVGLQGAELEYMNQGMGIGTNEPKAPMVTEHGEFVLHTVKPGDMSKLTLKKGQV